MNWWLLTDISFNRKRSFVKFVKLLTAPGKPLRDKMVPRWEFQRLFPAIHNLPILFKELVLVKRVSKSKVSRRTPMITVENKWEQMRSHRNVTDRDVTLILISAISRTKMMSFGLISLPLLVILKKQPLNCYFPLTSLDYKEKEIDLPVTDIYLLSQQPMIFRLIT